MPYGKQDHRVALYTRVPHRSGKGLTMHTMQSMLAAYFRQVVTVLSPPPCPGSLGRNVVIPFHLPRRSLPFGVHIVDRSSVWEDVHACARAAICSCLVLGYDTMSLPSVLRSGSWNVTRCPCSPLPHLVQSSWMLSPLRIILGCDLIFPSLHTLFWGNVADPPHLILGGDCVVYCVHMGLGSTGKD
jgi:hypothetical protein